MNVYQHDQPTLHNYIILRKIGTLCTVLAKLGTVTLKLVFTYMIAFKIGVQYTFVSEEFRKVQRSKITSIKYCNLSPSKIKCVRTYVKMGV